MAEWELAQINIARLIAPLDDPRIAGFVSELATVNALAESSPGFRWRLQSSGGDATDIAFDNDPLTIANMSVWDSIESLREFTYRSREHMRVFRDRAQWFQKMDLPHYCLWWVPAGHRPSVTEGRERLEEYRRQGPTPSSFWFGRCFEASAEGLVSC